MRATRTCCALTVLENRHYVGAKASLSLPQTISLATERWGAFLEASYKFYVVTD